MQLQRNNVDKNKRVILCMEEKIRARLCSESDMIDKHTTSQVGIHPDKVQCGVSQVFRHIQPGVSNIQLGVSTYSTGCFDILNQVF